MKTASWISAAAAAVSAAILPACDLVNTQEIKPGITSASEVKQRMGPPGFEFSNADGSVTWEYTRQPAGVHCYMITIGNNQIVQKMEQVLNDAQYAKALPGLNHAEVRRLYGQPANKAKFENLNEEVWEWRIDGGASTSEEVYFNVHFDTASGLLKKAGKRIAMKGS